MEIIVEANYLRIYNKYRCWVWDTTIHFLACGVPEQGTTFDVAEHRHAMAERSQRNEAFASLAAATYHPLDCWGDDSFCSCWCYNLCFVPWRLNLLQSYLYQRPSTNGTHILLLMHHLLLFLFFLPWSSGLVGELNGWDFRGLGIMQVKKIGITLKFARVFLLKC